MRASRNLGERRFLPIATALALLWLLPCVGTAQTVTLESMRDTLLDNGLQVIVAPNAAVPIATIMVVVRSGAFTQLEQPDAGLPHVLEHMLFKRRGGDWWSDRVSELDATYNGTTAQERVTYHVTLPAENVDEGIKTLSELVRSPRFEEEALDSEKQVVQGELERRVSDPYSVADMATDMVLWGAAFRQKNAIGNVLTIRDVTLDQLEAHLERFYVPNNAALIVTGDVDAAKVFESAARHFRRWRRGDDPFEDLEIPPIPPLTADSALVVSADASEVTLMIRWQGPAASEDRDAVYSAALFSQLVNQPTSGTQSRLVDSGLFSFVSMSHSHLNHVGPIELMARTTPDRLRPACAALVGELDQLTRVDYFNESDLAAANKRARVGAALGWQSTTALAYDIAGSWSVAGLDFFLEYFDSLSRQTAEDIQRYVAAYIDGQSRVISILLSSTARRGHGRALRACLSGWRTP